MDRLSLVFVFIVVVVAALKREVNAVSLRHRHRHQRLRHLQDAVDRLVLRQRTDHILITNLQKALTEAQEREVWRERTVKEVEEERKDLKELRESLEGVKGSVKELLKEEERQHDLLEMKEELALLRAEVRRLKASRETENARVAAQTKTQKQRESVTAVWVVDNIRRLQDAVVDLQEAFNVTTAMHDKQEVESRLAVVSGDLSALRGSLATVTSKAEAAAATATALQEELTRTSHDSHSAAGRIASLETEISDMRGDFNSLLTALPDGIIASSDDRHSDTYARVLKALEEQRPKPTLTERGLESRVEAVEVGMGEVQTSSMKLMSTLEALEARVEKDVGEVRQEVAKLEYKMIAKQDTDKT